MNNLNILKNTLGVVNNADKYLENGMPLYQVKSLFDGLVLAGTIDFDSQYGELLRVVLDTKRKDTAAKNIIYVRSILQTMIKDLEVVQAQLVEFEKKQDSLAIDSTCVIVTGNENKKEVQLQLNDIPKKIGRPKSETSLSGAERAKRARDKKKANKLVTIQSTLSMHASILYKQMIDGGYDLNSIIEIAHNQAPLDKD